MAETSYTSLEVFWCYVCEELPVHSYLQCQDVGCGIRVGLCVRCLDRGFQNLCPECFNREVLVSPASDNAGLAVPALPPPSDSTNEAVSLNVGPQELENTLSSLASVQESLLDALVVVRNASEVASGIGTVGQVPHIGTVGQGPTSRQGNVRLYRLKFRELYSET